MAAFVLVAGSLLSVFSGVSAESARGLGCTAIAVDGRGSSDGSAYAGMNADCSSCDGRLAYISRATHEEGAKRPLYIFKGTAPRWVGHGRNALYEPKEGEELSVSLGEIPQVKSTFAYWEAVLPLMNEKGLAMGESSCAARLLNYPAGQAPATGDPRTGKQATEGQLDLTNMMQIALERCETARCAAQTMGDLADNYGFFPMVGEWSLGRESDGKVAFDDGGEAVTLADRKGEAWIFHVVGGVPGVSKSVWAAMRLPKGHMASVANNFVLREVPEQESEDWLFSSKMRATARAAGLWQDGPFDFARVFAPDTVTFESPAGSAPIPLYATLRQWALLGLAAPSSFAGTPCPVDPLELPSTVAAEKAMHHTDVFGLLSTTYEGTEFDLSNGILAGPFGNPFRNEGGNATTHVGQIPRGVSIARTTYSVVGQSRMTEEPVMWIAPDTPVTSVYVPFYAAAGGVHSPAYARGTLSEFTRESAFWAFDFVSNWVSLSNWQNATGQFVKPLRKRLHDEIAAEMPAVEARAKLEGVEVLAKWQQDVQQRVVDRWWKLADELIMTYNDQFYNDAATNQMGLSLGYPEQWARSIGFNEDVHPIPVKRAEAIFTSALPSQYDFATKSWLYAPQVSINMAVAASSVSAGMAFQGFLTGMVLITAFFGGRVYERRNKEKKNSESSAYLRLA